MDADTTVRGFTIRGSGAAYFDAGIWIQRGTATIRENRITDNAFGVWAWCFDPDTCQLQVVLENNIIDHNTRGGINSNEHSILVLRNNTVVRNDGDGVVLNNNGSLAENNLVVGNSLRGLVNNAGAMVRYNNVWANRENYVGSEPGEGGLSMDPMFRDMANRDYRLHAGSPAVGHGIPTGTDMGALPFVPKGEPPPAIHLQQLEGMEWELRWSDSGAKGYNIYIGTSPRLYTRRFDVGRTNAYRLSGLPGNLTYYVALAGYDDLGDETALSDEVHLFVPAVAPGTFQEDTPAVVFDGTWNQVADPQASGGGYAVSETPGDTVQITFTGESIAMYRRLDTAGGWAEVIVDGKNLGFWEFYFAEPRWQVPTILDNLGEGIHTLTLRVSERRTVESTGYRVYVDAFTVPSPYKPTTNQLQAVDRVNWYRQKAGILPAQDVQSIHLGAQRHAEFLADNIEDPRLAGLGSHQQHPDLPGYVGRWPTDRARYFGYMGGLGEDVHFIGDPIRSVDDWMAAVYHRNLIMCWPCVEVGYGMINDHRGRFDVLNMGSRTYSAPQERVIYTYPADGQTDVPQLWWVNEIPDPLPGKPRPVGYPLSLYIQQPARTKGHLLWSAQFPWSAPRNAPSSQWKVTTAELRDETGTVVPTYLLEQNTDPILGPDNVFLIAQEPLTADTTYFVHIAGIDSQGAAFDHQWTFATGSVLKAPDLSNSLFWAKPVHPDKDKPITFFIQLINTGAPAQKMKATITIPEKTRYVAGSATTSQGTVTVDEQLVFDVGTVTAGTPVTLAYAITIDPSIISPTVIRVPTTLTWTGGRLHRDHVVIANGMAVHLPMIERR